MHNFSFDDVRVVLLYFIFQSNVEDSCVFAFQILLGLCPSITVLCFKFVDISDSWGNQRQRYAACAVSEMPEKATGRAEPAQRWYLHKMSQLITKSWTTSSRSRSTLYTFISKPNATTPFLHRYALYAPTIIFYYKYYNYYNCFLLKCRASCA